MHALPLPARKAGHVVVRVRRTSRTLHRRPHGLKIARPGRHKRRSMRVTAAHHKLLDPHAGRLAALRQDGHPTRDLLAPHARQVLTAEQHAAPRRDERTLHQLDGRGLAAAVRPQNRRDLARAKCQANVLKHAARAIGKRDVPQLDGRRRRTYGRLARASHSDRPLSRITSHTKNGPPTNAMRMPTGSS